MGVHNKVVLYRWVCGMDDSHKLESECSFATHILALKVAVRGELILVGDLMKSASLLVYKAEEGRIEEHARDCNSAWTTAVECVDDDTFVLAENENHLLLLRKNGEAATDEERHRLEVAGEFHLGEFVNCFRHGSLVMRLPDSDLARIPTMLYGTINGVLGVLAFLPADQYAYLTRLQGAMCSTVQGVGGLSWAAWRDFSNGRRTSAVRGFVDGDLVECVPTPVRFCARSRLTRRSQVVPGPEAGAPGGCSRARAALRGGARAARGGAHEAALTTDGASQACIHPRPSTKGVCGRGLCLQTLRRRTLARCRALLICCLGPKTPAW